MSKKHFKHAFSFSVAGIALILIVSAFILIYRFCLEIYRHNTSEVKVKNFYVKINSALDNIVKSDGNNTVDLWKIDNRNPELLFKYFEKYLPVAKDCKTDNNGECIYSGFYKLLDGKPYNNYADSSIYYKIMLNDGSALWLRTSLKFPVCNDKDGGYDNVCGLIWYDLNASSAPNVIGEDVYVFVLLKDKIVPYKQKSNVPGINGACSLGGGGWGCSEKIIESDKKLKYKKI